MNAIFEKADDKGAVIIAPSPHGLVLISHGDDVELSNEDISELIGELEGYLREHAEAES
jgi:predicted RNase H-like HicB family nuclease